MESRSAEAHADRLHLARLDTARRKVAQFRGGAPDWAERPLINDATVYTDAARHAAERQKLFCETPLIACFSADLPEPGSFRLFDKTGLPILIVRGKDMQIRAFVNTCSHRGAPLVREESGKASRFTCWFHAWTYSAEGKLTGVPQREGFEGCLGDRDLVPVPAAERYGLVFVQAMPGLASLNLETHLGRLAPELEMLELAEAMPLKSNVLTVAANWKFVLDTYGEGYHFASLHRDTIAPYFRADIQVYDRFGPHHKITWAAKPMASWAEQPEESWPIDDSIGWVHYIYPNSILFSGSVRLGRPYYTLYQLFPGEGPGQTTTLMTTYIPGQAHSEAEKTELEAVHDSTVHIVTAEDYDAAARCWRNLAGETSGRTVIYGRQEVALQNVHFAIAEAIGAPPPRGGDKT
jgi:nitrite reductase/ring-hydroxylating ferredoxin subunit